MASISSRPSQGQAKEERAPRVPGPRLRLGFGSSCCRRSCRFPPGGALLVALVAFFLSAIQTCQGQDFPRGGSRARALSSDLDSSALAASPLSSICPASNPNLNRNQGDLRVQVVKNGELSGSTFDEASSTTCKSESKGLESECRIFAPHEAVTCGGILVFAPTPDTPPSGDVFLVHDMYVAPQGHVFNETHLIFSPETATTKFHFSKGSTVIEYERVVYMLPRETAYTAYKTPDTGNSKQDPGEGVPQGHHRRPTYRHLVEGLIPAVGALSPLLKAVNTWPVLLPHSPAVRGVAAALLGVDITPRTVYVGEQAPAGFDDEAQDQPIFVRNLILPDLPRCSRPSTQGSSAACQATWRPMRERHLVPSDGLPLLTPQWVPRPSSATASPGQLPGKLPSDWVVILAFRPQRPDASKGSESDEAVRGLVLKHVSEERVVLFDPHVFMRDIKALFSRAVLVVGYSSLALSNLVFLPFGAAVIELCAPHRCTDDFTSAEAPPAPLPISFHHLAQACQVRWRGLMCNSKEDPQSGPHLFRRRFTVDCSEQMEALENLLEETLAPYSLTNGATGTLELPSPAASGAPASDEDSQVTSLLKGLPATVDELPQELWEAAYNGTNGENRTRTVLFRHGIPRVDDDLPQVKGKLPGVRGITDADVARFKDWQACVLREGRWEYNATPRALPWEYTGWHNTCDVRHEAEGGLVTARAEEAVEKGVSSKEWTVREALKYDWQVPQGKCVDVTGKGGWHRMDGRELCRLGARYRQSLGKDPKGGFHILIVGDSMQEQFAGMFMNMLLWHVKKPALWAVNKTMCYDWVPHEPHEHCKTYQVVDTPEVCPGGLTLQFVSNRWLTIGDNFVAKESVPWFETRGLEEADLVMMNRGAHYTADDVFRDDVKKALNFIRLNFPDKLVVYRTTPAGHDNCTYKDHPITKPDDPAKLPYNWGEFLRQNEIAKPMVETIRGVLLDVVPFMALRADGHRSWREFDNINFDCLHYCSPGPPDVWTEYLYNMLLWLLPSQ